MASRNEGVAEDQRILMRVGVHLGDVVEEADGDLMGDEVNVAARLEGVAPPGGICLSEDVWRQVKGRIHVPPRISASSSENIAEPIQLFARLSRRSIEPARAGAACGGDRAPSLHRGPAFPEPWRRRQQDDFVDGITESLTSDLSRISGAFVIARNTAFTYKRKAVDVKRIGRELNVRYVLEGSVQHGGQRMRVSVQLIDAGTGSHLWSERFDKQVADLFDMQDEIVSRLANRLEAARRRGGPPRRRRREPKIPWITTLSVSASIIGTVWSSFIRPRDAFRPRARTRSRQC